MDKKRQREIIVECFAFTIFFAVISYKLTNASLWFDETIEYWYSKYIVGTLPWQDEALTMYDRIITTAQPPLFNVILYFWLKIHDSEWWIRLFGVIMGLIGARGIYKTVLFGTQSHYKSSIAIIFYAMIYNVTYYWQEVSEYALMMCLLSWTVYYFLQIVNNSDVKKIILFVIFCVLSVYSQYGAIFLVLALGIMAFIKVIIDKNKRSIIAISGSYIAAGIFAALPLYLFFIRPQMIHQGSAQIALQGSFSIKNFCSDFFTVFKWSVLKDIGRTGQYAIMLVITFLVIVAIWYIFKGEKTWMRYLLIANIVCYTAYYIAVFLGFYANVSYNSSFGNRYNLFLIPLWFITSLLLVDLFLKEILETEDFKYAQIFASVTSGVFSAILICWSCLGWLSLSDNWSKENIRGATEAWISNEGYNTDTIIYTYASSGFSYYAMHNSKYNESILDKVVFQPEGELSNIEWLDTIYQDWPSSLYIIASHVQQDDLDNLISVFTENGYVASDVYNFDGGRLIYLEMAEKE